MNQCPCGSELAYEACCQPVISGARRAETAEQLMRARYSAYARVEVDFIHDSTHPKHRKGYDHEGTRQWAAESEWEGLDIVSVREGGVDDLTGEVEFIARFKEKGVSREHHEVAQFKKDDGTWLFTDGKTVTPRPIISTKVGRNDPCTCGSGLKYKKCCGR